MSTLIQIRGVAEHTRDELAARASRRGQSLTAYVRDLLDAEVARPELSDLFREISERNEEPLPPSAEYIRRTRDAASE